MAMGITSGVGRISSIISPHYSIPKCPALSLLTLTFDV